MQVEIRDLIEKNQREGAQIAFSGPIPKSKIQQAERELGVTFPPSYRAFLEEFGAIEIHRSTLAGLTQRKVGEEGDVVTFNRYCRKEYGLPTRYVALNFDDQEVFLSIDTARRDASCEAPIVLIDPNTKEQQGPVIAPSFGAYLIEYLSA